MIAAKLEGKETAIVKGPPHAKPAIDILEALRKSLSAVKKPPAHAEAPSKRRPLKKTGAR